MPNCVDAASDEAFSLLVDAAKAVSARRSDANRFEKSALYEIEQALASTMKAVERVRREHETRMRSMATAENRSRKAGERRQVAADMRRSGMTYVEIGKHIGVSAKRARDLAAGARD